MSKTDQHPQYINRELSWLEFNSRVLREAQDCKTPLLERFKFLSIFSNNLDEFYMKRVGKVRRDAQKQSIQQTPDGRTAEEILGLIHAKVTDLNQSAEAVYRKLVADLADQRIMIVRPQDLSLEDKQWLADYFDRQIFPVLTPLAVDSAHPFPFISNLSTSLGVCLRAKSSRRKHFARVKTSALDEQLILLPSKPEAQQRFISVLDVVQEFVGRLFPGMQIINSMPFRVTRYVDVPVVDEDAEDEDLLEFMEGELQRRRFAQVVRLEYAGICDKWMLSLLKSELSLGDSDIYQREHLLEYHNLKTLYDRGPLSLKYKPWKSVIPLRCLQEDQALFETIRSQDLLVHHPYESFSGSVERFLKEAINDPAVLAIKMTVYRAGDKSRLMPLLIEAAERGKQVVVLLELRASFEEAQNINWAVRLEKAGAHVLYGTVGLKTHAKLLLVVRRENEGIRSYVHIGTGNYRDTTAHYYTDLSFFTARYEITNDVVKVFHYLTGKSDQQNFSALLVAPLELRKKLESLVEREIQNAAQGLPARVIIKCNNLEDPDFIALLYRASQANVKIDLIIRGVCCLVPGLPGISDNIQVLSVLGRFLEHSRIFYFANGASDPLQGDFFIGSSDLMHRNFNTRVEVLTPIIGGEQRQKCFEILYVMLNDQRDAWEMQSDGSYRLRSQSANLDQVGSQDELMERAEEKSAA